MKLKSAVIIFLFTSLFLVNCVENKENEGHQITAHWELKNVSGGFAGIDLEYAAQDVILEFYQDNTVLIHNNTLPNTEQQSFSGFVSGTFSYQIKTENSVEVLYINNIKQGEITFTDLTLIVNDNLAADGFLKTFEKTIFICGTP